MNRTRGLMGIRVAAFMAGLAALAPAFYGSAWLLLAAVHASQEPDPSVPPSDPDFGPPDTWGEVVGAGAGSLVLAAVVASIVVLAAVLVRWALVQRWPSWRRVAVFPASATLLIAAAIVTVQLIP